MSEESNSQIYGFITRQTDPLASGGVAALKSIKDAIFGDSLDVPFVKWIQVLGTQQEIEFAETAKVLEGVAAGQGAHGSDVKIHKGPATNNKKWSDLEGGQHASSRRDLKANDWFFYDLFRDAQKTVEYSKSRWGGVTRKVDGHVDGTKSGPWLSKFKANEFVNVKLPDHGDFTFTKKTDNATPQLAYACSAQEPLKNAVFCYRRRIGLGVRGVRVPFLLIWLQKCRVVDWGVKGETESVTLRYKEVRWCAYDQVTDWNVATGMSARYWDTEEEEGGETIKMYAVMAALAAAVTAAALATSLTNQDATKGSSLSTQAQLNAIW